jgi:hypothetical protein
VQGKASSETPDADEPKTPKKTKGKAAPKKATAAAKKRKIQDDDAEAEEADEEGKPEVDDD